jgi:hypothetical protein
MCTPRKILFPSSYVSFFPPKFQFCPYIKVWKIFSKFFLLLKTINLHLKKAKNIFQTFTYEQKWNFGEKKKYGRVKRNLRTPKVIGSIFCWTINVAQGRIGSIFCLLILLDYHTPHPSKLYAFLKFHKGYVNLCPKGIW